jgi:hypothetical protein
MATKERAAQKAVSEATEQLARLQSDLQSAGDEPAKRRPGWAPKAPMSLEHAEHALETARREHARLAEQRAQVQASIRGIGHDYHFVDLERGVRRNGQLIASDIQGHIEQIRSIAQHEGLSQSCVERIEKAERVVPKMQATIEFVSGYVRQQVRQLDLAPTAAYAMHAHLIPSYSLDRVTSTRTVTQGEPLRALAERLRTPLFEPGGALSTLSPMEQHRSNTRPKRWRRCFSAPAPMWKGETGTSR